MLAEDGLNHPVHLVRLGNINLDKAGQPTAGLDELHGLKPARGAAIRYNYAGAFLGKSLRRSARDTRCGAGHHRYSTLKPRGKTSGLHPGLNLVDGSAFIVL
jgi:hypothetical protein